MIGSRSTSRVSFGSFRGVLLRDFDRYLDAALFRVALWFSAEHRRLWEIKAYFAIICLGLGSFVAGESSYLAEFSS